MKVGSLRNGWRDLRAWCAVFLIVLDALFESSWTGYASHLCARAFHIHHPPAGTLGIAPFGMLMVIRLTWAIFLWAGVCSLLRSSVTGFPFRDRRWVSLLCIGFVTGLAVMAGNILGIHAFGAATVTASGQTANAALIHGSLWLLLDFIGALGEEIVGRASILITAERFLGWKGAVLVSGILFSGFHLGNPGASRAWLLRLFLQGAVLAYAVFRTGSLWWSTGYHTGWNWISAPLFGAAGSGYLDEGHIFDFVPHGSVWITGGAVGPEGSMFAFLAVLTAIAILSTTTRPLQSRLG